MGNRPVPGRWTPAENSRFASRVFPTDANPAKPLAGVCLAVGLVDCGRTDRAVGRPAGQLGLPSQIGINNAGGTETLTDFPLLVSLNASNFDFAKAKPDGTDLRFTTPTGTLLSYEIEKWDPANRTGIVWVKVPQIDPGSAAGYIQMYFGNPTAPDGQNVADVWSNGYVGVWHLGGSGTAADSTGNYPGTINGTGVLTTAGIIGDARSFAGDGSRITASGTGLNIGDNLSITYWMKGAASNQPGGYTRVISKNTDAVYGWEYQRGGADAHQYIRIDTSAGNNQVRSIGTNAFDGNWHFLGTTISSGTVRGYLDGSSPTTNTYSPGGGFANTEALTIGARVGGGNPFRGLIDEVRISNVVRSPAWMNAEYRSQSGQMAGVGTTQLVSGLVAEYSHEDPLNRTADTSGHGHQATAVNGVTFITPPSTGGFAAGLETTVARFYRPSNQYLDLPASLLNPLSGGLDQSQGFTFTALVYNDGSSDEFRTILSSNRFRFQRSTGGVYRLDVKNTSGTQTAATGAGVFQDQTWYFVALRYDAAGNLAQAYVLPSTGVLAGPMLSMTPNEALTNLSALRIGSDGLSGIGSADPWGGMIDNARFFQGALSKRQLRDIFYSYTGYAGGPIGLVARYSHETASNRLADDTGHGLTLGNSGVDFVDASATSPGAFAPTLGTTVGRYVRTETDYLTVPELYTPGDDFTFIALVRKDNVDPTAHQTILASENFRFQYRNGYLGLDYRDGATIRTAQSPANAFPVEQWQMVALTYNAATDSLQAYLQPDSPVWMGPIFSVTGSGINVLETMRQLRIGRDGLSGIGSADPWGGWIDEIRFYDQAFTKKQLREIFRQYRPGTGPGPIGLLAQYSHEGPDPLQDDTGHLVTLRNQGSVSFVDPATLGGSTHFQLGSKVGQYTRVNGLDIPSFYTEGDPFTFVALVRKNTDESGGHQTILASDRFRFQYQDTGTVGDGSGQLGLDIKNEGGSASGTGTFRVDQWYFVALVYDPATGAVRAYMQPEGPVLGGPVFTRTSNLSNMTVFRLGNDGLSGIGGTDPFGGWIDGARFYDQALSTRQLRDIFRTLQGLPPGPLGLVARYDHENPANRLQDTSGNGLDATNGGSVTFGPATNPGPFQLGTVGQYPGGSTSYLDIPNIHTPGDDFTFIAMVRKQGGSAGHQTILGTDRFRFQYRSDDGYNGVLRLDLTSAAGGGTWETPAGSFPANQWDFVVLQYNAATGQMLAWLQDGSPVFLGPDLRLTVGNRSGMDAVSKFRIGMDGLSGIGAADAFIGQIDAIHFYDTLLTKRQLRDVFRQYNPLPAGYVGLVAEYSHENAANRLADDTGHGVTATNRGGVSFVPPPPGGIFQPGLGTTVGSYNRQETASLDFAEFYTPGDDFTFTALLRKDAVETDSETILATNRFRLQFHNTGSSNDGAGELFLQVNGAGASGPMGSGAGTFLTDQWYFVALRYNASSHVLEAFLDNTGGLGPPLISQVVLGAVGLDDLVQFRMGADGLSGLGGVDPFGGWIDRIQFYDRYLSNAELHAVLSASVPEPATLGLLALGLVLVLLRAFRRRTGTN